MSVSKWFIVVAAVVLGVSAFAAEGEWQTNCESAYRTAKKEKKLVLVVLSGSDWCPPCKRLKSEVLDQAPFKEYAKTHLVLVNLDFPRAQLPDEQRRYNRQMARNLKAENAVPVSILLDSSGRELFRITGYDPNYLNKLKAAVEKNRH